MTIESIISKLSEIIHGELRLGEGTDINTGTTMEELGVDSIAMMQLLVFVEESFGFEFSDDVLMHGGITCIDDMANYILKRTA